MRRLVVLVYAAVIPFLAACSFFPPVMGSGRMAVMSYTLTDFTKVAASQACTVRIVPDTSYSVKVTCDDNLLSYLDVRKDGSTTLHVGLDQSHSYMATTFRAEVHVPTLTGIELSGASQASVDSGFFSSLPVALTLSGASYAALQGISCAGISADVSGASSVSVIGSTAAETLVVSGASTADLTGCTATSGGAALSGASKAKMNVGAGSLSLSASGASVLYYTGSPQLYIQELSGGSSLVRVY